jgi:hypothetical protein
MLFESLKHLPECGFAIFEELGKVDATLAKIGVRTTVVEYCSG